MKYKGFLVASTIQKKIVAKDAPGQVLQFQLVLLSDSLVKAFKEAISNCPSDSTVIGISISEIPVFGETLLAEGGEKSGPPPTEH